MNLLTTRSWIFILQVTFLLGIVTSVEGNNFHSILGKSIYIPDEDLLGSIPNGITFFKNISSKCLRKIDMATTVKDQSFYKNTAEFYKSLATQTNLKASYESHFSLGFTLDATTKTVSGKTRSVSGTSLNLATKAYELQFSPNCLYETNLQSRVLKDFAALKTNVTKPWRKNSWRKYQHFLKIHGSHVITAVTYGSSIDQYAFAEESSKRTAWEFTVKACSSLAMNDSVKSLGVPACSGVSKKDIQNVTNTKMTTSITVKGGTHETRSKVLYDRSVKLILQFLGEGNTNPTPIEFTLTPVWQILSRQSNAMADNSDPYVRSINLQYYYDGYLNFGCPYIPAGERGPEIQKFDHAPHSSPENPVFQCTLAPSGCHDHLDCHYRFGAWCGCDGPSCIRYSEKKLSSGATRTIAAPYHKKDWAWNGCGWKVWGFKCGCKKERTRRLVVF